MQSHRRMVLAVLLSGATAAAQSEPTIETVAGTGSVGASGDGGPALLAGFAYPSGLAVDGAGNVFFGAYLTDDSGEWATIRRIDAVTGIISTVAGGGSLPYPNDGQLATDAAIRSYGMVAVDAAGNVYFDDLNVERWPILRRVDATNGTLSTIAGGNDPTDFTTVQAFALNNGETSLFSYPSGVGDGGPATSSNLYRISDIAIDSAGNVYVGDWIRVRRIDAVTGIITTVAGDGVFRQEVDGGFIINGVVHGGVGVDGALSTDGGLATQSGLVGISGIAFDAGDNLYIAESGWSQALVLNDQVVVRTGQLSESNGYYVDGDTGLTYPVFVYQPIAAGVSRIRRVDAATGVITTVAGAVDVGVDGDGVLATIARIGAAGLALDASDNLFFADGTSMIRRVDSATGILTTIAGIPTPGFGGDGGPASLAQLSTPWDIAFAASGDLFVTDYYNYRVRKITGLAPVPSTYTSAGQGVVISPLDPTTGTTPVELTFANVTESGQTSVVSSETGPAAPVGFKLGTPPIYFELSTTAQFSDTVEVCFDYSSYLDRFGSTNVDLFHGLPGGTWEKITISNDTTNHILCGVTSSFSPFAIMEFAGPVADAGPDQSIHAGQVVHLDGSGSYDGNAATESLAYSWTISLAPAGSAASLTDGNTVTPSFVADLSGVYRVTLVVTDLDALVSNPDSVQISSLNQVPTAIAGDHLGAIVGQLVTLNGTASSDPDHDPLAYLWTILSRPSGSSASLGNGNTATPSFTPDMPGTYTIQLVVSDGFASSAPAVTIVTAITALQDAEARTMQVIQLSQSPTMPVSNYTNLGNKRSFEQLLLEAVRAMQTNNLQLARKKLQNALDRTDGYTHGTGLVPDTIGPGRDWVIEKATALTFYVALLSALNEIAP